MKRYLSIFLFFTLLACTTATKNTNLEMSETTQLAANIPSLIVLGTVQDAGSPHIGCKKECCRSLFEKGIRRHVVSLGVIDPLLKKKYLFEASPDIVEQLRTLNEMESFSDTDVPDGIFLTHAHIGHYTGLMYLGKEAKGAKKAPVYAMPKMKTFLETNGPWSQLVANENIKLYALADQTEIQLSPKLSVKPITVPHRDEYSETVGYLITGPSKKVLFIPDIDKWEHWDTKIESVLATVDYAFLDATFYDAAEVNHRDISQIPHPFIVESMARFDTLSEGERNKIHFIHLNHTNPALDENSKQTTEIRNKGYHISKVNSVFTL